MFYLLLRISQEIKDEEEEKNHFQTGKLKMHLPDAIRDISLENATQFT